MGAKLKVSLLPLSTTQALRKNNVIESPIFDSTLNSLGIHWQLKIIIVMVIDDAFINVAYLLGVANNYV